MSHRSAASRPQSARSEVRPSSQRSAKPRDAYEEDLGGTNAPARGTHRTGATGREDAAAPTARSRSSGQHRAATSRSKLYSREGTKGGKHMDSSGIYSVMSEARPAPAPLVVTHMAA